MEENLCRICMTCTDDLSTLFNYENESNALINETGKMFIECLQLELKPYSGHSEYICNYCKLQLTVFYNFMIMAKRSHLKYTLSFDKKKAFTDQEEKIISRNNFTLDLNQDETETKTDDLTTEDDDEQWIDDNGSDYQIEYLDDDKDITEAFLQNYKTEELSENDSVKNSIIDLESPILIKGQYNDDIFQTIEKEFENSNSDFKCIECNEIFLTKKEFKIHKKLFHPSNKYECEQCGKKFKVYEMYESHLRKHEGLSPFECKVCNKTFNYNSNYQNHLKKHSGEKPYPCTLCDKSFRSKWDVIIHTRVHKDIRKYKCNICDKRFRVSSHMTSHQYTHYEKQFECDICFQKYTSPRTLKQHKNTIHSDIFPYKCDWCERKFKRKHHIVNHMKTHTKPGKIR